MPGGLVLSQGGWGTFDTKNLLATTMSQISQGGLVDSGCGCTYIIAQKTPYTRLFMHDL